MEVVVRPLFMEWKRFLPTKLSKKMLGNILANKQKWQAIGEKEALAKVAVSESQAIASTAGLLPPLHDGNRNNASISQEERCQTEMEGGEVEEEGAVQVGPADDEEEGHGEEADIVENDINLAFHYQTDSEQLGEGGVYPLLPMSEEEQLMLLARNSRRRHSMPVVVRKDLGFYMGLRRDSFTRSNFQRRQSLPATPVQASSLLSRTGAGDSDQNCLSVDGLTARPKISNLSSCMDTPVDYLSFLPLQSQTRLLQWGTREPNDNNITPSHPHLQSSSCTELRQRSHVLKEDSERLKAALSGIAGPGVCHQELVGLASSWPSILRAGQRVDEAKLKLLANEVGLALPRAQQPDSSGSPSTSNTNSSNSVAACLSTAQTEGVTLLSRPHWPLGTWWESWDFYILCQNAFSAVNRRDIMLY